jgi:hypothetical protein
MSFSVNDLNRGAPSPGAAYATMPLDRSLHTTVYNGRRYVAIGKEFQGTINSYNNFFTKWVMRTFFKKYVIDITIEGKKNSAVCVNRKSYEKFLDKMGCRDIAGSRRNLSEYTNFSELMGRAHVLETGIFMKDKISAEKSDKLANKMIAAIERDDHELALKILGKGANFNKFILLSSLGERLSETYFEDLPKNMRFEKARFLKLPLMLFAYYKNLQIVGDRLEQYGASNIGEDFEFKRVLTESTIERRVRLQYVPKTTQTASGETRTEYKLEDRESVYQHTKYKDVYTNRQQLTVMRRRFEVQTLDQISQEGRVESLVSSHHSSSLVVPRSKMSSEACSWKSVVAVAVGALAIYGGLVYLASRES